MRIADDSLYDIMIGYAERLFNVKTVIVMGSIFLAVSAFVGWIDEPIFGWVKGYEINLSENLPSVISYGSLSIVLSVLSLITLSQRFRWLGIVTGFLGILLSVSFFLDYSIVDSRKIAALNDLYQQKQLADTFSRQAQLMVGTEESNTIIMNTGSVQERVYATFKFIALGAYLFFIGSLIIVFTFFMSRSIGRHTKYLAILLGLILFIFYVVMTVNNFIAAEYHRSKGDYHLSAGLYREAVTEYEQARNLDATLEYINGFRINSGKAYFFSGMSDKADYNFYLANRSFTEGDLQMAIYYIKTAALQDPFFSGSVGDRYLYDIYNRFGMVKYKNGLFIAAIKLWEEALKADTLAPLPYFFLSRAYFDINSFDESIMAGERALKFVSDETIKSYVSANIADSYFKLGRLDNSREYYLKSLALDKGSSRALMSLAGQ